MLLRALIFVRTRIATCPHSVKACLSEAGIAAEARPGRSHTQRPPAPMLVVWKSLVRKFWNRASIQLFDLVLAVNLRLCLRGINFACRMWPYDR
jgi:hypothetical protein